MSRQEGGAEGIELRSGYCKQSINAAQLFHIGAMEASVDVSMSKTALNSNEDKAMRILWDRGGASVSELAVATRMGAAQTLNTLRGLVRKGAAERRQSGRDVLYRPLLNQETARTHTLGRLLSGDADTGGLGIVVLRECDVDPQDWADLQAEIAEKKRQKSD